MTWIDELTCLYVATDVFYLIFTDLLLAMCGYFFVVVDLLSVCREFIFWRFKHLLYLLLGISLLAVHFLGCYQHVSPVEC